MWLRARAGSRRRPFILLHDILSLSFSLANTNKQVWHRVNYATRRQTGRISEMSNFYRCHEKLITNIQRQTIMSSLRPLPSLTRCPIDGWRGINRIPHAFRPSASVGVPYYCHVAYAHAPSVICVRSCRTGNERHLSIETSSMTSGTLSVVGRS